ncbi:MAG: 50S ribosomal protein L17 [Spirochaetia bacterium]|nr:50S ribosomal protein L17 [Spirochaetia bacterium]
MRHGRKAKKFRREMGHRTALFKNLARELLLHGRIRTTVQKAKYLRGVVEPLITRAKVENLNNIREAGRVIKDKALLTRLFKEIGPFFKDRKGGYTRIMRLENRPGDNAEMALIELVGADSLYKKEDPKEAGKKDKKSAEPKKSEARKEVPKEDKKEPGKEEKKEKKADDKAAK